MINAQEAYERVCKQLDSIDITDDLAILEKRIEEAIEKNALGMYSQTFPWSEAAKAEKLPIYLQEEFGYNAAVVNGPNVEKDGAVISTCVLSINWKFIPSNVRESLNTRF